MKKDSLPYKILINIGWFLEDMLDLMFSTPPEIYRRFSGYPSHIYTRADIYRGLYNLKKYGYLKTVKNQYQLTRKGKMEILKYRIQNKRRKWDGKWRLVIFDVPEEKRGRRNTLRNRLRYLGFKELQKSVWVYPYEAEKELRELLKIYHYQRYARFLTVEKMSYDKDLKKAFGLKS